MDISGPFSSHVWLTEGRDGIHHTFHVGASIGTGRLQTLLQWTYYVPLHPFETQNFAAISAQIYGEKECAKPRTFGYLYVPIAVGSIHTSVHMFLCSINYTCIFSGITEGQGLESQHCVSAVLGVYYPIVWGLNCWQIASYLNSSANVNWNIN